MSTKAYIQYIYTLHALLQCFVFLQSIIQIFLNCRRRIDQDCTMQKYLKLLTGPHIKEGYIFSVLAASQNFSPVKSWFPKSKVAKSGNHKSDRLIFAAVQNTFRIHIYC